MHKNLTMAQLPAMLNIFSFLFFYLPTLSKAQCRPFKILPLPSPVLGPEAFAFDPNGSGPYTGVSDGRVLRFLDNTLGFVEFAVTSPNRTKELCDGSSDPALEPTCGRPLGLGFYNATGDLYIADAYYGLVKVGSKGGIATQLATSAEGVPFRFPDAVDVDQDTGTVYFTDASAVYQKRDLIQIVLTDDRTGRLIKYDPNTRNVTVLLRGLAFPVGTAISKDGTFVIVSEATTGKIIRYWLRGPRANTSEIFGKILGQPDNIRRNAKGEFWIAVNIGIEEVEKQNQDILHGGNATLATEARPLPLTVPSGIRLSNEGRVLQVMLATDGVFINQSITEVQEFQGSLYIGSIDLPYVVVYGA